jgi:YegS/Rv2252/BmrU family lipid kinase
MHPSICIIFNPAARSEKARRLLKRVQRLAENITVKVTSGIGDARSQAAKAVQQGYKIIVAAGGDGTLNEVVNGMAGSDALFGVLPVGTMNVFALELGIPQDLDKAWEIIRAGHVRHIDLAKANDQYFLQLAGVGFDAQVVSETAWDMKRSLGPLSYLLTGSLVAARKPPRLMVETGQRKAIEGTFVLIGNGRFYGGPYELFKGGRIDDGLLDVYVFQKMGHLDIVRYMSNVLFQSHDRLPDVKTLRVRSLRVTSDENTPVEVDGELLGHVPVNFEVLPGAFRVLAPEL